MSFNKELFCNFINVRYLLLTFFVQRDNRWVNSDNANISFTIYGRFKILYCHFQKIDFSNFKLTFAKHSFLWQICKVLLKFYYVTKLYHVDIFDSIMVGLRIYIFFYFPFLLLSLQRLTATKISIWVLLSFVIFLHFHSRQWHVQS